MQSPKRCRVSSRETEEICSQSPISKDSCSDNSSHDQEIDYDELSEEELHGLHGCTVLEIIFSCPLLKE